MKHPVTAQRLRQVMDEVNMKAVELSERSGIGKSSISQYMNGTHAPSNVSAGRMSPILGGVNPMWLMGFDAPKYPVATDKAESEDRRLLSAFHALNDFGRQKVAEYIADLLDNPRYTEKRSSSSEVG